MTTLHINTSQEKTLVALCDDKTTIDKKQWFAGDDVGGEILTQIDQLLKDNKLTLSALELITVNKNPGRRTSANRAALTVASCLAYTQKIPVKKIS